MSSKDRESTMDVFKSVILKDYNDNQLINMLGQVSKKIVFSNIVSKKISKDQSNYQSSK